MRQPHTRFVHLPDLEITTATHSRRDFPRHIHDSFCIGLVQHGARIITTQNTETRIGPGELFVLNPRQPHSCKADDAGTSYHVINIAPEVMDAFAGPCPAFKPLRIVSRPLAHHMQRLCSLAGRDYTPLERETCLVQLLSPLIAHGSAVAPSAAPTHASQDVIKPVLEYIHAHYTGKPSLTELARLCHRSPYHFQRIFVKYMGLSPHDYLMYVRIKHSKTMLRDGCPIADVAQNVGFVDQSHFTHSFKRIVGMTPGYFAAQHH